MSAGSDPAFPTGTHKALGEIAMGQVSGGLTKREYFAAKALQALLALPQSTRSPRNLVAEEAVMQADALLKELAK
jgi:hypothetical protein